jgi:hypothetical protein
VFPQLPFPNDHSPALITFQLSRRRIARCSKSYLWDFFISEQDAYFRLLNSNVTCQNTSSYGTLEEESGEESSMSEEDIKGYIQYVLKEIRSRKIFIGKDLTATMKTSGWL